MEKLYEIKKEEKRGHIENVLMETILQRDVMSIIENSRTYIVRTFHNINVC